MTFSAIFVVFSFFISSPFFPLQPAVSRPMSELEREAYDYLVHFGYTNKSSSDVSDREIKRFQRMAGVTQTGILDDGTVEMIRRRRCGVPDVTGSDDDSDKSNYRLANVV